MSDGAGTGPAGGRPDPDEQPYTGIPDLVQVALQPMLHVGDMHRAVVFFEALGATIVGGNRGGDYVEVEFGGARLALLAHPAPEQGGAVELQFAAPDLDAVQRQVVGHAEVVAPPADFPFGRQLQLRTPDGMFVKVNQLDPARFANPNGG